MDDLQRRFRPGEPDAVRAVYRRYGGAVHTVARSIVGDDLAGDVVQQSFVKAWRAAASFDTDRDLAPWLYAIARRTAIDVLRVERAPTRSGHGPEVEVGVEPLSMERTWEVFEVRRALDDLPEGEREVVRLSHCRGLDPRRDRRAAGGAGGHGQVALGAGPNATGRRARASRRAANHAGRR